MKVIKIVIHYFVLPCATKKVPIMGQPFGFRRPSKT